MLQRWQQKYWMRGNLSYPVYLGLRTDKKHKEVVLEKPAFHMKSK